MSAPSGRRSESELLKHRELKEAASPQRTATMCAEAGKIGSRRIPNIKNARVARAFFLGIYGFFACLCSFCAFALATFRQPFFENISHGGGVRVLFFLLAEEQALDKAPAIKDTLSIKTDISAPNGAPIISIKS